MSDVSVVIPTFNRWPMVSEAVGSVIAQQGVDFELIVVDDGSTDETPLRLRQLARKSTAAISIVAIEHQGPAAARNRGVAAACSPFIAFLDSDDLWCPGKLWRQLQHMKKKPECLVSQTNEIWLRGGVRVNAGRRHRKREGNFFFDSLRTCLVSPSAVMMRTATFHDAGGFDEDMQAAEDYDLWLRLLLRHNIDLLSELMVIRRAGHANQLSATVPALDRFRILALLKLLFRDDLSIKQREAVCDAVIEKCSIYGKGALRRGHAAEAGLVAKISEMSCGMWRLMADRSLENAIDAIRLNLARHRIPSD